jgi:6-phosphogluconolactonase (cycloisomerase 2 family)
MDGNSRLHKGFEPGFLMPGIAEARSQEIKRRMRTRFAWLGGTLILVCIGVLMACSSKYTSHFDGLVVVSTQGDAVMQTFSLDLGNGQMTQINNVNGPPTVGVATSVLIDPAGAFAYVASQVPCTPNVPTNTTLTGAVQGAIFVYPINSDGTLGAHANPTYLPGNTTYPGGFPTCGLDDSTNPNPGGSPSAMVMDSAGKYLFVAEAPEAAIYTTNTNTTPVQTVATLNSTGVVVYAIGSGGALTQVAGSPFALPVQLGGQPPQPSALAVTPTVYPTLDAPCSTHTPPTSEDLYVTDYENDLIFNYTVSSTGSLTLVPTNGSTQGIPTGTRPNGVAVDPCNRFVYVGNQQGDSVSAYTICNVVSLPLCPIGDYSLLAVAGSPFNSGNGAGPLTVDPYGGFLYVLASNADAMYAYKISSTNGALTPMTPAFVATGVFPTSIAIRSDDSFMFVANYTSGTLSEYGIAPGQGTLTVQPTVTAFPTPWGVAVK